MTHQQRRLSSRDATPGAGRVPAGLSELKATLHVILLSSVVKGLKRYGKAF